jgi:hypothetical protein
LKRRLERGWDAGNIHLKMHQRNPEKASCECHEEPLEKDTIKNIYDGSGEGSQKF